MKTQIITLKITIEDEYSLPNAWNWEDLLDLSRTESVEIINVQNEKE